jgi:hypothetical protein
MQTKQPSRHNTTTETIEYIEKPAKAEPFVTFDEVDEELMDQLVDRRIHGNNKL